MVRLATEVPVKETLLNVSAPPKDVITLLVSCMFDVPALNVKFEPEGLNGAVLDRTIVLEPKFIALTITPVETISPAVTLKLAVVNVPCVIVSVLVDMFSASPSVSVIPAPFTVTPLKVLPAVVRVPVPVNDTVPL
jgi:hypothetical protein